MKMENQQTFQWSLKNMISNGLMYWNMDKTD